MYESDTYVQTLVNSTKINVRIPKHILIAYALEYKQ